MYKTKPLKRFLSYLVITSMLAPDIACAMLDDVPQIKKSQIKRRQSLPSGAEKNPNKTTRSKSHSLDTIPTIPQLNNFLPSLQKRDLIENSFEKQQPIYSDIKSPLNLTELLRDNPIEPVVDSQESSTKSALDRELKAQEEKQESVHLELSKKLESTQKAFPSEEQSTSPPVDLTHSASASPSKDSNSGSGMTEESKSLTLSSSTESPRKAPFDLNQQEKQGAISSSVSILVESKDQNEEAQRKAGKDKNISLEPVTLNFSTVSQEPLHAHEQISSRINLPSETEKQKAEILLISIGSEKPLPPPLDKSHEVNPSEKTAIAAIKPDSGLAESPPSDTSPRKGQDSTSRRNSTDSSSDQGAETRTDPLANVLLREKLEPLKEAQQGNDQGKPSSDSNEGKIPFNFIGDWKKPENKGKKLYLRTDSERTDKRSTAQDNSTPTETTSLMSRPPQLNGSLNIQSENKGKKTKSASEWVNLFSNPGSAGQTYELVPVSENEGEYSDGESKDHDGNLPNNREQDVRIDLEEAGSKDNKPLPKLVPDWFKEQGRASIQEKDTSSPCNVSLVESDSEDRQESTLLPIQQSRFLKFLNSLSEEQHANLRYVKKTSVG